MVQLISDATEIVLGTPPAHVPETAPTEEMSWLK
jgi:hypothetical protein